jgi:nicotinamidase-related amidase
MEPRPGNDALARLDMAQLVVVDVQGKLARLMRNSEAMIGQLSRLIQAARLLDLPVVWVEQLPDKLGPTVPEIAEVLDGLAPLSKSSFGCCGDEQVMARIEAAGRRQVLLCGIETHVCVWQTARELRHAGYDVHLIADASSSRSELNRDIAWRRMEGIGVKLSCVEMALFELMVSADHPRFRDVSRLLK